jgi:hypothetical protein
MIYNFIKYIILYNTEYKINIIANINILFRYFVILYNTHLLICNFI